jgi:hypothetical protein
MNYLDMVKRVKLECGVAGVDPTTVTGQIKEIGRICAWVAQAWVEIQEERPDYDFLRKPFSFLTSFGTPNTEGDSLTIGSVYKIVTRATLDFEAIGERYEGAENQSGTTYKIIAPATLGAGDSTTLAGKQAYTVGNGTAFDINLPDFGQWKNDSFRAYLKSAGIGTQIFLSQYYDYSMFRDFYLLGSRQLVTGRPIYVAIEPSTRSLLLGFTPNDVYWVSGEYYRTPQVLTVDADTPIMPERYHMAIVYRAMIKYGLYYVANEQIEAGKAGADMIINRLKGDQTPQILMGASLI